MHRGAALGGALLAIFITNLGAIGSAVQSLKALAFAQKPAQIQTMSQPQALAPRAGILKPEADPSLVSEPQATAADETETAEEEEEAVPLPQVEGVSAESLSMIQQSLAGIGEYIRSGAGVHLQTAMPQDHVQINPVTGRRVGFPANYAAPSKLGVYFPFLLKVAQEDPFFARMGLKPEDALALMKQSLLTLREFQRSGEGKETYAGLLPWFEMKTDGSLGIAKYAGRKMVPLLDNGQATLGLWAWMGDETLRNEPKGTLAWEVRELVKEVLAAQHYERLVSKKTGQLFAEWDLDLHKGVDKPDHVSLWTEWVIASYLTTVEGHITERDWMKFTSDVFAYRDGKRVIDMPKGFIFSMHEQWALVYLSDIIMKSKLEPLFRNYLYLHAKHSLEHDIPGIVATEYGPGGYEQAGIRLRNQSFSTVGHIDNEYLATSYGTAIASLIAPTKVGMEWARYHFSQPGVLQTFGPVTSFTRKHGPTPMHTADATFVTAVALAGGVSKEVTRYAQERYGKSEAQLIRLFDLHAEKILRKLKRKSFRAVEESEIPLPPVDGTYYANKPAAAVKMSGPINIMQRLEKGHWHGDNVSVPLGYEKWKETRSQGWVLGRGEIVAQYQITREKPYAWLGTSIKPVSIAGVSYISLWIPVDLQDEYWEIELKNNGVELSQRIRVHSKRNGDLSTDGSWKRIVLPVRTFNASTQTLNYVGISVPNPFNPYQTTKQGGKIHLKDLQLHSQKPPSLKPE